ncbi:response regulator transcription factor [Paenibacillus sp. 2KB_22]|uniref:response regulator transcription factor n=1 Tax=Paenibacillus sp. 2KB_22 TaxID=3232978 RepID=UPI003F96ABFE
MRLLIADDDDYTREGLSESFKWEKFGINEIILADDGAEALRLATLKKPEIVLTDIRMPKMSGIEFAEQLAEKSPDSQLLFMSGYKDVQYLKSAIKLSAIEYIEKPIKLNEVEQAIEKSILSLRTKQKQNVVVHQKNELMSEKLARCLRDEYADTDVLMTMCSDVGFPSDHRYLGFIIWNRLEGSDCRCDLKAILSFWNERGFTVIGEQLDTKTCFVILAYERQDYKKLSSLIDTFVSLYDSYNIALGKDAGAIPQIWRSFLTAQRAMSRSFYCPNVRCFYDQDQMDILNETYHNLLPEFYKLRTSEPQKLIDWITSLCETFKQKEFPSKERVAALFETVIQETVGSDPKLLLILEKDYKIEDLEQQLRNCTTIDRMEEIMLNVLTVWLEATLQISQYSKQVQDVLNFIATNYRNVDLDLQMIADYMNLSTAHVGFLFKQETGTTIKQYITDYRMDLAKQLVSSEHLKMSTIAELCGYASASYFAKVFKISTELSPLEYRRKK